jgi:hypothetical protein
MLPKLDVRTLNLAVDRLLEKTTNPRHRFLLAAYARHRLLEVAGRYKEIFAPDMTVPEPVYHFDLMGAKIVARGRAQVEGLYRMWAQTHQSVFYIESEEIAVADHFVSSVTTGYQQVSGKAIRESKLMSYLPSGIVRRLLAHALAKQSHAADENDMYLFHAKGVQMIWPYDDQGRLIGEDVWEPEHDTAGFIKLDPKDVLTTAEAGRLLSPLIKPLPPYPAAAPGATARRARRVAA